jgi:hypothetical protein
MPGVYLGYLAEAPQHHMIFLSSSTLFAFFKFKFAFFVTCPGCPSHIYIARQSYGDSCLIKPSGIPQPHLST